MAFRPITLASMAVRRDIGSPGLIQAVYYPLPESVYVNLGYGNLVPAAAVTSCRLPMVPALVGVGVNCTGGCCINPSIDPSFGLHVPSGNTSDHASEKGGDNSASGKKVKFLCRFGGKIVPRPSDEGLRYVGGQTKIIRVRRDLGYSELVQKMAETYGQNSNVVIKYQLPDGNLDTLVSVSGQDDLENMMDEYDKLVDRSSADRIAKLRVFLFSASELDSYSGEQRYVEAVNGHVDALPEGGLVRGESIDSLTSTQSSEFSRPPSTGGFAPQGNPVGVVKSVPPLALSVQPENELERCVPLSVPVQQQQIVYNLPPEYVVQINPSQIGYPTQILSTVGSMFIHQQFHDNIRAMPLNRTPV